MSDETLKLLKETGALLSGHFELSSGLHSDQYLQYALLLQYPDKTEVVCQKLADLFRDQGVSVVIGPALGGVIVSFEVARQLGARSLFAEREEGTLRLRRNFEIQKGEKVLIVEDVVTTGQSVHELIDLIRSRGGEVVGVGALADRSGRGAAFGVPFKPLATIQVKHFPREDCPLCKEGIPLTKPGSRRLKR